MTSSRGSKPVILNNENRYNEGDVFLYNIKSVTHF